MKAIVILAAAIFSTSMASASQVTCFEQNRPEGDSPGINRYLSFDMQADGNWTLNFDPSCKYGSIKQFCYPKTTWENLRCTQLTSPSGKTFSWTCSIPGADSCFFARLWTDASVDGTPAGTFEFDSFRDCWIPSAGDHHTVFKSSGMITGCSIGHFNP
ncbi:MAG: hypothetical protein NTV34_17235 [Proteobacteria bacterium]|nr:hypothetical protein [Pseudomonadota bacterium]